MTGLSDGEARALLAGVDGPRPLPDHVRTELESTLTGVAPAVVTGAAPHPLPEGLRHRLEAALVDAGPRPLPRRVRRRVLVAVQGPSTRLRQVVGVAAAVVLVAGVIVASQPDQRGATVAGPGPGPGSGPSSGGDRPGFGSAAGGSASSTPAVPFGDPGDGGSTAGTGGGAGTGGPTVGAEGSGGGGSAGGGASPAAGDAAAGEAIAVAVVGEDDTDVAAGFHAYLRTLNAAGGIDGRPVTAVPTGTGSPVATVNVGRSPVPEPPDGILFETVFVDEGRLRGPVVSLASPVERQARLAVARAYPEPAPGRRAAVYVGMGEPWAGVVADAFDVALRRRGVTPVHVPFSAARPTFLPASDSAFLSMAPDEVAAWVAAAPAGPPSGTWGIASAWDDRLAERGSALEVTVLSPYRPAGGEEEASLVGELPDRTLTAGAVHGWVTAKAVAVLLARNGGTTISQADLDGLAGWAPGWAPPFETRPGTRARTPDAVPLVPRAGRFVAVDAFQRDA